MTRLPVVDGDLDTWGDLLNEFLSVVHSLDGTLKSAYRGAGVVIIAAVDAPAKWKNVADYQCDGTADNVEVQAAINAGGNHVQLSPGHFSFAAGVSHGNLGYHVCGAGPGYTYIEFATAITAWTITAAQFTMGLTTTIRGIQFSSSSGSTLGTAIKITGAAAGICLRDVYIKGSLVGLESVGAQFAEFGVRVESCDVGIYCHQDATGGGGNNNTWLVTVQGCTVGLIAIADSPDGYPMHSNDWINSSIHSCATTAMYLDGVNDWAFDTPAHENNGNGAGVATSRYGKAIAKGTWHLNNARVSARNCQWTTGLPDPNCTLRGSILTFEGTFDGTSLFIDSDVGSSVYLPDGYASLYGRVGEVMRYPSGTINNPYQLLGFPKCQEVNFIANTCPNPRTLGIFSGYAGNGSTFGVDQDALLGPISFVQFAASVGDVSTNRAVFDTNPIPYVGSAIVAASVMLRADRDCSVRFDAWDTSSAETHKLYANRLYRLVICAVISGSKGKYVIVFPTTNVGAKLQMCNCHALPQFATGSGGNPERELRSFVHEGWFNPAPGKMWTPEGGGLLLAETTDPAAPGANKGVLYCRDNGAGKTQIVARFPSGAVQVLATEP